jgi:hypothetical protein
MMGLLTPTLGALAAGTAGPHQQQVAWAFIVDNLAGTDRMSFLAVDDIPMVMAWREGRRWVGLEMRRILAEPMSDPEPPPEPPARTMTERHRRRGPSPD